MTTKTNAVTRITLEKLFKHKKHDNNQGKKPYILFFYPQIIRRIQLSSTPCKRQLHFMSSFFASDFLMSACFPASASDTTDAARVWSSIHGR